MVYPEYDVLGITPPAWPESDKQYIRVSSTLNNIQNLVTDLQTTLRQCPCQEPNIDDIAQASYIDDSVPHAIPNDTQPSPQTQHFNPISLPTISPQPHIREPQGQTTATPQPDPKTSHALLRPVHEPPPPPNPQHPTNSTTHPHETPKAAPIAEKPPTHLEAPRHSSSALDLASVPIEEPGPDSVSRASERISSGNPAVEGSVGRLGGTQAKRGGVGSKRRNLAQQQYLEAAQYYQTAQCMVSGHIKKQATGLDPFGRRLGHAQHVLGGKSAVVAGAGEVAGRGVRGAVEYGGEQQGTGREEAGVGCSKCAQEKSEELEVAGGGGGHGGGHGEQGGAGGGETGEWQGSGGEVPTTDWQSVIVQVEVLNMSSASSSLGQVVVSGDCTLSQLKDVIPCQTHSYVKKWGDSMTQAIAERVLNSGYMFINNAFYIDTRSELSDDYVACVTQYLAELNSQHGQHGPQGHAASERPAFPVYDMAMTRVQDLLVQLDCKQYLYCHYGCCQHVLVVRDVRCASALDKRLTRSTKAYVIPSTLKELPPRQCDICGTNEASQVFQHQPQLPHEITYCCASCSSLCGLKSQSMEVITVPEASEVMQLE